MKKKTKKNTQKARSSAATGWAALRKRIRRKIREARALEAFSREHNHPCAEYTHGRVARVLRELVESTPELMPKGKVPPNEKLSDADPLSGAHDPNL